MDQHQMEEQLKGLTQGLNSVRTAMDAFKDKANSDITDFKRDITEKVVAHKYEVSEQISSCAYNCRSETAKQIATTQQILSNQIDAVKTGLREQLQEMKEESRVEDTKINERVSQSKRDFAEIIKSTKDDLVDMIKHRVKVVGVVSTILVLVMGWQWAYSSRTADKFDDYKTDISKEFSDFKDEIRTFLNEDVRQAMWELQSRQARILLLLEAHYQDTHGTKAPANLEDNGNRLPLNKKGK